MVFKKAKIFPFLFVLNWRIFEITRAELATRSWKEAVANARIVNWTPSSTKQRSLNSKLVGKERRALQEKLPPEVAPRAGS